VDPKELAAGTGTQRSCVGSSPSTLKTTLSRRCLSQARAIDSSSSGRVSSGRGTCSVGGVSGTDVAGDYGAVTVVGLTRVPPQTDVYQLAMVVPSVSSCVFLPKVAKDAIRPCRLDAF
jgi:hypothetical protein